MSESFRRGFDCGYNGARPHEIPDLRDVGKDFVAGYLAGKDEFRKSLLIFV